MTTQQEQFIASAIQTFLASFLTTLGAGLTTGSIQWSWAFWGALILTGVRAALKAVFAQTSAPLLGGKKPQ